MLVSAYKYACAELHDKGEHELMSEPDLESDEVSPGGPCEFIPRGSRKFQKLPFSNQQSSRGECEHSRCHIFHRTRNMKASFKALGHVGCRNQKV